jgi:hypothetical protein
MKTRSPARIIELCIYVLIIIAAAVWLLTGGRLYNPPESSPPPAATQTAEPRETEPPLSIVPRGDTLTGQ